MQSKIIASLAAGLLALAFPLAARSAPKTSVPQNKLAAILENRFGTDATKKAAAEKALAHAPADARTQTLAWEIYKRSAAHSALKAELEKKTVATADRTSPYLWRFVGEKPKDGWGLVIAMHGGGNAPREVNDGEWNYMFSTYYKEHPEAGGYVYLALRAPNDTWNGFYDDAICPLVERLIKQFVLFEEVNPDKVYTLGASHGGYGAYVIGPKIPCRFAAIHCAASAPTDGETFGENLRNVRFTVMVGEKDNGYGRIDRSRKFQTQMEAWRKQYGGYSSDFQFPAGVGHLVPDHDQLAEMLKYKRDAWPKTIVWTPSDNVLKRFYWLEAPNPVTQAHIEAKVTANTITLKADKQEKLALWLDAALVDIKQTGHGRSGRRQKAGLSPQAKPGDLLHGTRTDRRSAPDRAGSHRSFPAPRRKINFRAKSRTAPKRFLVCVRK